MNVRLLSAARTVWRKAVPARFRTLIWERIVRDRIDRAALKTLVNHIRSRDQSPTADARRLITLLEGNAWRPDYSLITSELGLEFKAYSHQDLIAYLYFNGRPDGFFVDVGAFDGIEISNTYALEKLGWQGICVEPLPEIYALLTSNRTCQTCNCALSSSTEGQASFIRVPSQLGLSGLAQQMPERIRKGLENRGLAIQQTVVDTCRFDEVMSLHPDIDRIDFLSIDVEGAELDVLDSIDFGRYQFGLITIENNVGILTLKQYMERRRYDLFLDLGVDLMFVPQG